MMKKFLVLLMSVLMSLFLFVACKGDVSEPQTATITFKQAGCEDIVKEVEEGKALTDIPTPVEKKGYVLTWSISDFSNITDDMTVSVIETPKKYDITLDADGGQGLTTTTYQATYDAAYAFPTLTKTGYTFGGWKNGTEDFPASGTWTTDEEISVKASWTAKTYTVELNAKGGTVSNSTITATYNQAPNLETPILSGYDFITWEKEDGTAVSSTAPWTIDSNITLYAKWQEQIPETITVFFVEEGQTTKERTVNYGGTLTDIPTPVGKTGYDVAWDTVSLENLTQNTTVEAKFTAKKYTVVLNAKGGTVEALSDKMTFDAPYSFPTPTKKGYNFKGWKKGEDAIDQQGVWTIAEDNIELTAMWEAKTYTVILSYNDEGATENKQITLTYGVVPSITEPTREGYTFDGWKNDNALVDVSKAWSIDQDNITLTATWKKVEEGGAWTKYY